MDESWTHYAKQFHLHEVPTTGNSIDKVEQRVAKDLRGEEGSSCWQA